MEEIPCLLLGEATFGGDDGGGGCPEPAPPCFLADLAGFGAAEVGECPGVRGAVAGAGKGEGVAVFGFGSAVAGAASRARGSRCMRCCGYDGRIYIGRLERAAQDGAGQPVPVRRGGEPEGGADGSGDVLLAGDCADDELELFAQARRCPDDEVGVAGASGVAAQPGQPIAVGPEEQLFGDHVASVGTGAGVGGVDIDGEQRPLEGADDRACRIVGVEDMGGIVEALGDRVRGVVGVDDDERWAEQCLVEA
ncbi:hypothetical protein [Amycolatopsis sp. NPDC004625]|uniref:hypothetical protein n=1 Tax=Amycolatopsis sp. NPDC004625 TaxID=3154670 RepID=UPI0033B7E57B